LLIKIDCNRITELAEDQLKEKYYKHYFSNNYCYHIFFIFIIVKLLKISSTVEVGIRQNLCHRFFNQAEQNVSEQITKRQASLVLIVGKFCCLFFCRYMLKWKFIIGRNFFLMLSFIVKFFLKWLIGCIIKKTMYQTMLLFREP
jgi:hypothetical protein